MRRKHDDRGIEELIAESQRLREEMMRTSAKLDAFAAVLASTVGKLRTLSQKRSDESC